MRVSASAAAARVNIATSVATWSLRERAVCSLPPTGPASSVTRRSIAMWMSSSSSANGNSCRSSSPATASSAPSSASRSSSLMIPCEASISACARDWATSCGHNRRSKDSEVFSARKTGSCGSAKRDKTRGSLRGGQAAIVQPGHLPGEHEAEQVQRDAPAEVRVSRARVETALGVAALRDRDRDEEGEPGGHEQPRGPAEEVARLQPVGRPDVGDDAVPEHDRQRGGHEEAQRADPPSLSP